MLPLLLLLVLGLLGGVVDAQPEYRVPAHTTPFWDQLFFNTEVSKSVTLTNGRGNLTSSLTCSHPSAYLQRHTFQSIIRVTTVPPAPPLRLQTASVRLGG